MWRRGQLNLARVICHTPQQNSVFTAGRQIKTVNVTCNEKRICLSHGWRRVKEELTVRRHRNRTCDNGSCKDPGLTCHDVEHDYIPKTALDVCGIHRFVCRRLSWCCTTSKSTGR